MDQTFLIKKAKAGDVKAFTELYKTIYKKLYQYAYYTLGNENDAEDAVSETVIDAFETIPNLRKDEAFESWIFQILRAKCNHRIKDFYAARNTVEIDYYAEQSGLSDSTEPLEAVIDQIDLKEALADIAPIDREIINLHIVMGYKTREIALLLGINENTVRSREARALGRLRKLLC